MCELSQVGQSYYFGGCPFKIETKPKVTCFCDAKFSKQDHQDDLIKFVRDLKPSDVEIALTHFGPHAGKICATQDGFDFLCDIIRQASEPAIKWFTVVVSELEMSDVPLWSRLVDHLAHLHDEPPEVLDCEEDTANLLKEIGGHFNMHICQILSETSRAMVVSANNREEGKDCVFRISVWEPSDPSCSAIVDFCTYFSSIDSETTGLVPMFPPHVLKIGADSTYLVEIYERVVFLENKSMDLFHFLFGEGDTDQFLTLTFSVDQKKSMSLVYLEQAIQSIAVLHDVGYCHMDISPQNMVLSKTSAYLIDFESNIPCPPKNDSDTSPFLVPKGAIQVPIKTKFLPIEHFAAHESDLVSLRDYDVWAWGVSLFMALFQVDLIPGMDHPESESKISYFFHHGFASYAEKHHPAVVEEVSRDEEVIVSLAWDLLTNIFIVPKRNTEAGQIVWFDASRTSADAVLSHPFWEQLQSKQ